MSGKAESAVRLPRCLTLGAALALAMTAPAAAQQPFARARLEPRDVVIVGQPVQLVVEVFVSTWFARAPVYPGVDIENAITTPPGRSLNLNERVDGQPYFGIRRAYTVYPQVAGRYEVPPLEVTVRPGGADAAVTVVTLALSFEARIPPEATAAGLDYFIGATDLTLSQSVEPPSDSFKVGDALTRTVGAAVYDALSLVIPPIAFDSIAGLALYQDAPMVTDEGGERGERIVGRRVEAATYVMLEEGDFELPALEISWWDLTRNRLRRSTVPAVRFHVRPNPDYAAEFALPVARDTLAAEAAPGAPPGYRRMLAVIVAVLVGLIVLLGLGRRFAPQAAVRFEAWRLRRRESEVAYFARFRRACRTGEPQQAMRQLIAWLDRATPQDQTPTLSGLARAAADSDLDSALAELEERLYAASSPRTATSWNGARLYRAVRRHRGQVKARVNGQTRAGELAPLNPPL